MSDTCLNGHCGETLRETFCNWGFNSHSEHYVFFHFWREINSLKRVVLEWFFFPLSCVCTGVVDVEDEATGTMVMYPKKSFYCPYLRMRTFQSDDMLLPELSNRNTGTVELCCSLRAWLSRYTIWRPLCNIGLHLGYIVPGEHVKGSKMHWLKLLVKRRGGLNKK